MKKLTEADEARMVELYERGKSMAEVALLFDVHPKTAARYLKKHRVRPRKGPTSSLGADEFKKMADAYESGSSTTDVAKQFGITATTVAKYLKENGVELRPAGFRKGADHHAWNNGRTINSSGYAMVLVRDDDPFYYMGQKKVGNLRYVPEHRYVMAQKLGRPLLDNESVHHIDGDRLNNRVDNLQLRQGRHGNGQAMCCADCGSHNIVPVGILDRN